MRNTDPIEPGDPLAAQDGAGCLRFGPFEFDRELDELRREGTEVELPLRCLLVLGVLLSVPGRTVSRERLLDQVWQGDFVTDTSLTEAVSRLRQALSDEARHPQYIQTVHGRGYKFIAPCEEVERSKGGTPTVEPSSSLPRAATATRRSWVRVSAAAVLLLGLVWLAGASFEPQPKATQTGLASAEVPASPEARVDDGAQPLYRLAEVTLNGEARAQYGFPPLPLEDFSVDPASGRLAFTMQSDEGAEIWLLQPNRGSLQRIASGGHFSDPVWTRDGRGLALAHTRGDSIDLMYGEPGSGQRMDVLLEAPHDQFPESWSADGRSLVFSERHPETGFDLWLLRQHDDGQWLPEPLVRTARHEAFGAISPDGQHVAYVSKDAGYPEVFVLDLDQPRAPGKKVSRSGGHSPFWSATGDRLHYLDGDAVWTLDTESLSRGLPPGTGRTTPVSGVFLAAPSSTSGRFVVAVLEGAVSLGRR